MSSAMQSFIITDPPETMDQNYALLRAEAIKNIQSLCGLSWTDHNDHDPGITTIDAMCYALTEQGYLNNISVKQLLQLYGRPDAIDKDFFSPSRVLNNAPVTLNDWRKFLIDQNTIRNAWLLPLTDGVFPPVFLKSNQYSLVDGVRLNLKGLYDAVFEWATDPVLGELNGNIISLKSLVTLPSGVQKMYWADLIFPFTWDTIDPVFSIFKSAINIATITLHTSNALHPKLDPEAEGSNVYFSDIDLTYNGIQPAALSIILRINTEIATDLERLAVEEAFILLLSDVAGPLADYNKIIVKGFELANETKSLLLENRNLAEDFVNYHAINIQEIGIQAEIELTPGTAAEPVLAEMFFMIHQFISPDFTFQPYNNPVDDKADDPQMDTREGPALVHGYLSDEELLSTPGRSIYLSDLLHLMLEDKSHTRHDKIIAIYDLAIQSYIDNKLSGASEENCLRLVDDLTFRPRLSIFKSQVIVRERGIKKPYDLNNVFALFEIMKNSEAGTNFLVPEIVIETEPELAPASTSYFPLQYEFPAFYDLSIHQKTSINAQMRGYLFFFEQLIADSSLLLRHVPELLSVENVQTETRFPANIRLLLPFYNDYLESSYETALTTTGDENETRRSLLLDHLLARLGEDFRYYGAWNHLTGAALNTAKYNFLKVIPELTANRYHAYQYSKVAWNTANTSVTEQKLVHLLQLPDNLRKTRWKDPGTHFTIVTIPGPTVLYGFRTTDVLNAPLVKSPLDTYGSVYEAQDAATSVIQWGKSADHYQIVSAGALFGFVILNDDLDIIAVSENTFLTPAAALTAIDTSANYYSMQWIPEEGLHLLETILLRPRTYTTPGLTDLLLIIPLSPDNTIATGFNKDLYSQNILVVLPSVGDRFGDGGYQEVASAIIRKELPACIQVRVVWLNIFSMHEFESAWQTWLQTLSNAAATELTIKAAKDSIITVVNDIYNRINQEL